MIIVQRLTSDASTLPLLPTAPEARSFPVSRFDPVLLAGGGDIRARASPRVQEGLCNVGNIAAASSTRCTIVMINIAEITCG